MRCANCGRELSTPDEVCSCDGLPKGNDSGVMLPSGPTSAGDVFAQSVARSGRSRRLLLLVLGVVVVAVAIGWGVYALTHGVAAKPSVFITFQAVDPSGALVTAEDLEECAQVVERRLAVLDIAGYTVKTEGIDLVVVGLSKDADVEEAAEVAGQKGGPAFYDVADFGDSYGTREEALASAGVASESELPVGTSIIEWPEDEGTNATDEYFLLTVAPALSADLLRDAAFDSAAPNGSYRVTLDFTDEGAAVFARVTKEMALVGDATGVRQQLAVVFGGVVRSAASVYEEIPDGRAEITGRFTLQEVERLVAVLSAGFLPLELVRVR